MCEDCEFEYDEDKQRTTVTMRYSTRGPLGNVYVDRERNVSDSYDEILEEMVWFLQSCGFSYITGLTALGEGGEELKTTNTF